MMHRSLVVQRGTENGAAVTEQPEHCLEDCSRQNLSPGAKNARGQIIKTGSACSRGNLSPGANCYGGFVPGRNFL